MHCLPTRRSWRCWAAAMCLMKCRAGSQEPYVAFAGIETRDWSVQDQKAHEHFATLEVKTKSRSRKLAQDIVSEIETALDNVA